jgi:hypothetical protein
MQKYIYLLQDDTGLYKIGMTSDLKARFRHLKHDRPFQLVHTILSYSVWWSEHWLHSKFQSSRVNGEWFRLSSNDVAWIKAISKLEVDHNMELLHKA